MASVPVSSKILLDAMLEKVGLPAATYSARPIEGTRLEVTIIFYPIKIKLGRSPVKVSLSTSQHQDLAEARHYVAAAAIKYMDAYEGVVPKDYHYDQLRTMEKANVLLGRPLKAMKEGQCISKTRAEREPWQKQAPEQRMGWILEHGTDHRQQP